MEKKRIEEGFVEYCVCFGKIDKLNDLVVKFVEVVKRNKKLNKNMNSDCWNEMPKLFEGVKTFDLVNGRVVIRQFVGLDLVSLWFVVKSLFELSKMTIGMCTFRDVKLSVRTQKACFFVSETLLLKVLVFVRFFFFFPSISPKISQFNCSDF